MLGGALPDRLAVQGEQTRGRGYERKKTGFAPGDLSAVRARLATP